MTRHKAILYDNFYPRPPRGGRLFNAFITPLILAYFYPRPPRGGRPGHSIRRGHQGSISIHALREEGDTAKYVDIRVLSFISIHALREEGDR